VTKQKLASELRNQHKNLLDAAKKLLELADNLSLYAGAKEIYDEVDESHYIIRDISTEIRVLGERFIEMPI
jgi:hypothetical protein